jgi:hypothetical protein
MRTLLPNDQTTGLILWDKEISLTFGRSQPLAPTYVAENRGFEGTSKRGDDLYD